MAEDFTGPLPPHDHAGRRARVRDALAEGGIDGLYVTGAANVAYLTGFTGSNGQVLVGADPDADALLTDARYEGRAAVEAPGIPTVLTRVPVDEAFERLVGRLGFEGDHLSYHQGRSLLDAAIGQGRVATAVEGLVEHLRVVKEPSELARIRRACAITVAAFEALLHDLRPGRTEHDLAVELERRFVDLGADGLAFDPIVAAGPNGAIPHHEPTRRTVERGDLVTFDIGARVDGYHADFTRTVAVGDPPAGWKRVHDLVVEAQQAGVDAVGLDADSAAVDGAARDVIEDAGFGEAFVHGVGHGLGLEIHEAPMVSSRSTARLAASTVLTVEPGIYLPAARADDMPPGGVRIEDTVLVDPDGPAERLTVAQHQLLIVPG